MEEQQKLKTVFSSVIKRNIRKKSNYFLNHFLYLKIIYLITLIIIILIQTKNILDFMNKNSNKNNQNIIFSYKNDKIESTNKNQIHITYSLDNKISYPTLVSMISGLENNNQKSNIIIFHLLLSYNFNKSNIDIFESLKNNYEVKINYYLIPDFFSHLKSWTLGTECIYYKIFIPIIFRDLSRIIHLDGDTLIRKDILEMYNYPFKNNYILGHPFFMPYVMDKFGINATHYITVGCVLFNIEKIINDKKDSELIQFTLKNNNKLKFPEQDAINFVFYPNIDFLPLKYGIYMIGDDKVLKRINFNLRTQMNLTEGKQAIVDPSIINFSCCWPKVWNNKTKNLFGGNDICLRYQKEFYYYANKTKYYSIIYDYFYLNEKI